MTIYLNELHRWNSMVSPPLGFSLNFLLIWLIFSKTPKEMQKHSRVLLQTCLLDTFSLAFQTIGKPMIIIGYEFNLISFEGYLIKFLNLDKFGLQLMFIICFSIHNTNICGISVQFLYRYLLLNRDYQIKLYQYFLILLFYFCLTMSIFALPIKFDMDLPLDTKLYQNLINFAEKPIYFAFRFNLIYELIWVFIMHLMYVISYVSIFYCAFKMVRFIGSNSGLNTRLKELNKQLTKSLIILAIFPTLLEAILIIGTIILIITQISKDDPNFVMNFTALASFYFHWLPLMNPIVTIYVNRPYRNAIFKRVKISPATLNFKFI